MILGIYTIKDKLATAGPFIYAENENVAKRTFVETVKGNPFIKDLDLYALGSWDNTSMDITKLPQPEKIMEGEAIYDEICNSVQS